MALFSSVTLADPEERPTLLHMCLLAIRRRPGVQDPVQQIIDRLREQRVMGVEP